jgi:hypothetical protein
MLDDTFRQSGVAARWVDRKKVTRFQVLGERSSGTNYVKRLLGRNTSLTPTEALGWKHGFPHARAIPPDLLVVGCVRRADDWLLSMHAKPWHASPALQSMPFSDFIRAPWDTRVDRARYFEGAAEAGEIGQPLMHDRHPLTGAQFENLLALRRAKLTGLLSYAARDCNYVLLRMEDAIAAPEALLGRLALSGQSGRFRPVVKRLGAKFKASVEARPATPSAMSADDLEWTRQTIDAEQEASLGYHY